MQTGNCLILSSVSSELTLTFFHLCKWKTASFMLHYVMLKSWVYSLHVNTQFKLLRLNVCLTLTSSGGMIGRWERFDRQFYQPYLLHSSEVLQTDVKSDIFVADFPLDLHFSASVFLWGLLVGIKAISCFLIVYKFWPVSKSRSLIAVAAGYLYFRICRVCSHRQVKFRNKSDCLFKPQSRNSLLTNQLLIG